MVYGLDELYGKSWPDTSTASQALEDFTASRLLGTPCWFVDPPSTMSKIDKGPMRISRVTSGRVGDPRTGVTIGYSQTFAGVNQAGQYCSVYVELEILDGTYYGNAQCRQNYSIKLSPTSGTAESGAILTSIEPGKTTVSSAMVAKVYDNNGQLVPNAKVKLVVDVQQYSGGHLHHDGLRDTQHMGKLAPVSPSTGTVMDNGKVLTGNTGSNGLYFTFAAPAPAGDHKITASCTDGKNCALQGPDMVWVGIKNLVSLPGSDAYVLLPNVNDPKHPDNHYMTYTAMLRVTALAALYHGQFPDNPLLHLNDASLERGGLFDYKAKDGSPWKTPHKEHRHGINIDVRANPDINQDTAIPAKNFEKFKEITIKAGGTARLHSEGTSNQHYHVRF